MKEVKHIHSKIILVIEFMRDLQMVQTRDSCRFDDNFKIFRLTVYQQVNVVEKKALIKAGAPNPRAVDWYWSGPHSRR